jgi:2'-5' RNA ligase
VRGSAVVRAGQRSTDASGQPRHIDLSRAVDLEQRTDAERADRGTPQLVLVAHLVQVTRVPLTAPVAFLGQPPVDLAPDFHERTRQRGHQRRRVGAPGAVDDSRRAAPREPQQPRHRGTTERLALGHVAGGTQRVHQGLLELVLRQAGHAELGREGPRQRRLPGARPPTDEHVPVHGGSLPSVARTRSPAWWNPAGVDAAWQDITETAIIAAVPAAEPLVHQHRLALDPGARLGVPAHVTVLYPFVAPAALTDDVMARVAAVAAGLGAVEARLATVGWFGTRVVYLAPEPDGWFRGATAAVHEAFPQCPPYLGAHEDVVPHLTIGDGADPEAMQRAADQVQAGLPVTDVIDRFLLIGGSDAPGSWRTLRELPLAAVGRSVGAR